MRGLGKLPYPDPRMVFTPRDEKQALVTAKCRAYIEWCRVNRIAVRFRSLANMVAKAETLPGCHNPKSVLVSYGKGGHHLCFETNGALCLPEPFIKSGAPFGMSFSCKKCGAINVPVDVPPKRPLDTVEEWMQQCQSHVRMAHLKRDIRCKGFEDVEVTWRSS